MLSGSEPANIPPGHRTAGERPARNAHPNSCKLGGVGDLRKGQLNQPIGGAGQFTSSDLN